LLAYHYLQRFVVVEVDDLTVLVRDQEGLNEHIAELMRTSLEIIKNGIDKAAIMPEY